MTIVEPVSTPRLRFHLDETNCVNVTNLDSGASYFGAAAEAMWQAKVGRDQIAVLVLPIIQEHIPDYDEYRLDVGETVVFGLPAEFAESVGEALTYDITSAALTHLAEGRLAAVWA